MEMRPCPQCGAENSTRRDYCYQCGGSLRGEPSQASTVDYVPTCANCSHAAVFPPPGHQITSEQVWCTKQEGPVPSGQLAGDCYEEAFGWKREDILD
jgi:hypothetical protein